MNLVETEEAKLSDSPTAFAFGLNLDNKGKNLSYDIHDLLEVKTQYHISTKGIKDKKDIDYHNCTIEDFHYLHKEAFYNSKINNYKCLSRENLTNNKPQGIYTDKTFTYYVISIESKDPNNTNHNQLINDYLTEYDCKLQLYYIDLTMDLDNVKNPFSSVLNSMFLQLNPTLVQKRNIFFLNYRLKDDKYWVHMGGEIENETNKTGLSRIEDYSLYKGLNRTYKINGNYTDEYNVYAKIYIRVDNKNVVIKRKYQDVMEFYADTSALLLSLFFLLGIIFSNYDRIKANHSISKKLFYFEGTENNNFSQFIDLKKILNSNKIKEKIIKSIPPKNEQPEPITIKNKKKGEVSSPVMNKNSKFDTENKGKEEGNSGKRTRNGNIPDSKDTFVGEKTDSLIKSEKEIEIQKENEEEAIQNENQEKTKDKINYSSYNIFEMFGSFKIFCKTKKFEQKINLMNKSKSIIDDKLDIIFYIRNMILFELINKIYLENQNIINFLSRPIIYFDKKEAMSNRPSDTESNLEIKREKEEEKEEEKEDEEKDEEIKQRDVFNDKKSIETIIINNEITDENKGKKGKENSRRTKSELYKSAYKFDYDVLSSEIERLKEKNNKTETEEKLVKLLKKHLDGIQL